jgi:hypothetical protein
MNKRHLHHAWTRLRRLKAGYFLAIAVVSGVTCVFALRANNEHMIKLRAAVYAADQNNTGVQAPLQALQAYVTSHMNTDLSAGNGGVYPPVQLKYTYDRLVTAQSDQAAQANLTLYSAAQAYCEQQDPTDFSGRNRVPCIEQYVQTHDTALPAIPDALYQFDFVSPAWSPDLAGWSLVVAVVSGLLTVISYSAGRWFRRRV